MTRPDNRKIVFPLPQIEGFLYASVGTDRSGTEVTVLSALARLGYDPWQEALRISALSRQDAIEGLKVILSSGIDVQSLKGEIGALADELSRLLPFRSINSGSHIFDFLRLRISTFSIGLIFAVIIDLILIGLTI